jgi:hypothetical protein
MAPYEYSPLPQRDPVKSTSGDIFVRLVQLPPGDPDGDIWCSMLPHRLSEAPEYEAVSYCWGDSNDRTVIQCDGKTLEIQSNLKDFLLRTRAKGYPRTLWIDSICVNQADDVEKGGQVLRMKDIYERAMNTLIWLGKEENDSMLGLYFAKKLSDAFFADKEVSRLWYKVSADMFSVWNPGWVPFLRLFERAWFTRSWIVQEVVVSKDAYIICGSKAIPWDTLVAALIRTVLHHPWVGEVYTMKNIDFVLHLKISQMEYKEGVQTDHYRILARHREAEAGDPRDKIYAFHGLSCQQSLERGDIRPDYTISTEELYVRVARATLEASNDLDPLSIPRIPSSLSLPSWVPDWRHSGSYHFSLLGHVPPATKDSIDESYPYRATDDSKYDLLRAKKAIDKGNGLLLFGYLIDEISSLSDPWEHIQIRGKHWLLDQARYLQERQSQIRHWEMELGARRRGLYAPTGETYLDVMWQTCMTGIFPEGKDKARHTFNMFERRQRALRLLRVLGLHRYVYTYLFIVILTHFLRIFGIRNPEFAYDLRINNVNHRKATNTTKGYIGLAPGMAEVGDSVALLKGGKLPFIIRRKGDDWELVGDAYIHGATKGELWNEEKCTPIRIV